MKVKPNEAAKTKDRVKVAEEKRLQSIEAKRKEYKSHQNAIKAALASVDTRTNRKVIFDNEEETGCDVAPIKNGDVSGKRGLFDDGDDESEVEYNFEVREQFQGKKGKKLLELQSKYKNDKRFLLDERFIEDESGKSDSDDDQNTKLQENGEDTLEEEKRVELAILEEVLGKKVRRKPEEVKKATAKGMLRYDPSKPEHANLEMKSAEIDVPKKRKRKEKRSEEGKEAAELPEVSKETFYEVKQNLKESLLENQSFSMLNMFGRSREEEKEVQSEKTPSDEILKKTTLIPNKNPFRYDSSDNEVDETDKVDKPETVEKPEVPSRHISLGPQKLWTEPFFFKDDDYRFQEGFDFVRRFEVEDTEFSKVRRNIKEIVKAKVKHNQRKNKPFKKKLGGRKKMIKMKKAMKR